MSLCDPMDCSSPGSSVHGILQAGILECAAILHSRVSSQPRDRTRVSYASCIGRQFLYHQHHLGRPNMTSKLSMTAKLKFLCVCVCIPKSSQGLLVLDMSYLGKLYMQELPLKVRNGRKKIKCINNDNNHSSGNKSYYLLKVLHGHLILSYLISATLIAMPITT